MTPEIVAPPCRLCEGPVRILMSLGHAPAAVQTLLPADALDRDRPARLTLGRCPRCGLAQLVGDPDPAGLYSADYLCSVNFSAHARDYQAELAEHWTRAFGLVGSRVLEVGGGDGYFAGLLTDRGCQVTLIDPAPKACEAASRRGLARVVSGYLDERTFAGEAFEAIVLRHVLEHVLKPVEFLRLLRGYLKPGGRLLLEVPDLDGIIAQGRCQDFYPEHVSYFDPRSLAAAVAGAGFEILELNTIERGDYLVGVARRPARDLEGMLADLHRHVGRFRALVEGARSQGRSVAVWGAGGRCVALLALVRAGDLGIAYVVDSDPKKWGRFLPVTHLPVVGPDRLTTDPVNDVLIAATAFQDEIIAGLDWFRRGGGRLGVVQPEPRWLDLAGGPTHVA